jgi:tRNA 2-thiouridine synthesizing protein E
VGVSGEPRVQESGSESGAPLDEHGFLCCAADWSADVARRLAAQEGIELTDAHWEILMALRDYYGRFDSSPAMRALVKFLRQEIGEEQGRSIYLLKLFPGSPARVACRIAGLPKPANCL